MAWSLDAVLGTATDTENATTTMPVTTTSAAASGTWIYAGISWYNSGVTISSVVDNGAGGSLTWNQVSGGLVNGSVDANRHWAMYRAWAPSGLASGRTITPTFSGTAFGKGIIVASFAGGSSSSAADGTPAVAALDTQTLAPGNVTLADSTSLLLTIGWYDGNATAQNATTPTTGTEVIDINNVGSGNNSGWVMLYRLPGATGAQANSTTWAVTGQAGVRESLGITAAFTPSAGGGTPGAVTYVDAGAAVTATSGNVTPSYPAGIQADDILLCEVTSYDNVSVSFGGSGWTKKTETNNGTALRQTIAWKRRASGDSDTNVVITHTGGDRIIARVHALRNCKKNGDPFEATAVNTPAAAASGSFPNVTTGPGINDLLVYALSYGNDFSTGPSISNAQGLTLTERDETEVA